MLVRYILCDGSVLVRLSVLLRAEGPRDANSCRGTRRDVVVHAAYCYRLAAVAWSVRPCGLLLQTRSCGVVGPSMRPIATDAQQWRGRSTHAAYLLQTRSSGVVGPPMRPIAIEAMVEQPGGRRTGSALLKRLGIPIICRFN